MDSPKRIPSSRSLDNLPALSSPTVMSQGRFQLKGQNVWDILISFTLFISATTPFKPGLWKSESLDKTIALLTLCASLWRLAVQ